MAKMQWLPSKENLSNAPVSKNAVSKLEKAEVPLYEKNGNNALHVFVVLENIFHNKFFLF